MKSRLFPLAAALAALAGCGTPPVTPSPGHLMEQPAPQGAIPAPVRQSALVPPPRPAPKTETYSVVVNEVPVKELLFALARDAKINVDIHPGIEGNVTLNALNQTLPQLLNRISKQVDMRYELDGPNLAVMPDTPYLKQYKIDYLNMSRDATSSVSIATQIATTGAATIGTDSSGGGSQSTNNSSTAVTNTSNHRFWETLVKNVQDLLRETDKILPEGSSITTVAENGSQTTTGTGYPPASTGRGNAPASLVASPNPATVTRDNATTTQKTTYREAASVIANPENGLLAVRATSRQHEKVQEFLDQVMATARRQVLIEATVVEVQLSDQYQQGINWNLAPVGGKGWNIGNNTVGSITTITSGGSGTTSSTNSTPFAVGYLNTASKFGSIAAAVTLLEQFGRLKVLSSPKISVLNNQTAMLKVVNNQVYFTITAQVTPATSTTAAQVTATSEVHTVPEGFVMGVTPQIADNGEITLNVRPTVSRIQGWVPDPGLVLTAQSLGNSNFTISNDCGNSPKAGEVQSCIPVLQTKEMESVLRLEDRQIAIMGGLMEESIDHANNGVPGLSGIPLVGEVFKNRNEITRKSELVVFLRPTIVHEARLEGDFRDTGLSLPEKDFFATPEKPAPEDKQP